jgi:hypothetical protein
VVSVTEKAYEMRQVWVGKANESEPPMRRRNRIGDIETRVPLLPWEQPGGYLFTGLAVSGVEVARARSRCQCGTWERLAPIRLAGRLRPLARESAPSSTHCEELSIDAEQAGGPLSSSGEAPVTGVERRERGVRAMFGGQPGYPGGAG